MIKRILSTLTLIIVFHLQFFAQELTGSSVEVNSTTNSTSFTSVTGASINVTVPGASKVMLIATFNCNSTSGTPVGSYRIAESGNETNNSGTMNRTLTTFKGVGSVVHIFDLNRNKTFTFQHKSSDGSVTINTSVQLTAIVLYDGANQLNNDIQSLQAPVVLGTDWEGVLTSNPVTLPNNGGFYVSASVQFARTSGSSTAVGEWVLQYKKNLSGSWTDFGLPVSRTINSSDKDIISLVGILPDNTIADNYLFRVAHHQTTGTDPVETQTCKLAVVALGSVNGFFPVFGSSKASSSTTSTSLISAFETSITPQLDTKLFLHAQYGIQSNAASNAPTFDLYLKKDLTEIFNGSDFSRYLSGTTDMGNIASSGLASGLQAGQTYQTALRHASTTGQTLTTSNAILVGFGLKKASSFKTLPVTIYATQGLIFSSYSTLKEAFDAINGGICKGDIKILINDNTIETASCVLNASGSGSANYSTINIYPTASNISISGSLAAPLINLNGAHNVSINGKLNLIGTPELTFSNSNSGGSVIQYINDATSNVLRYCTILGVTSSFTSGSITFGTGITTGNDNNLIEYCNIGDGASTPTNAIYSAGSSVSADNSSNTIFNCNIFNYYNAASASNGILIASNSSGWIINNNKFYQTLPRTATVGSLHHAINIITLSGINYTVNNNIIGYSASDGTGTTTYGGAFTNSYRAIELTVGTSTASSIQGNTITGISLSTTSGLATAPGIFTGIYVLAGTVNIGTTTGNTIGATSGIGAISITSTTSLGYFAGIYATSTGTIAIQNNNIGSISTGGGVAIGYTFYGINTAGAGGNFTISNNTIGSTSTANSIAIGMIGTTTTGVCTFNGINNVATGVNTITGNTVQNCSVFGTAASVYNGIVNSAGSSTLDITGNNVIAGTNTGTGAMTGISNSAIVATLNLNNNIIRSHSKTAATGIFTAISNSGAVTAAININSNQLGNADGGLITYSVANSSALTGISNTGGVASSILSIQSNDIRGILHAVAGSSVHSYIINSAATLSQNISSNTFTNLNVSTTGNVTFITVSNSLFANGVQTVNSNAIVGTFNKSSAGGTVTFCNTTGTTSQPGSVITQSLNNFSNVTVTGATIISGWINNNSSLDKTISNNTFSNWTGGSAALNVMTITTGSSTITGNIISNMTTGTAAAAPIVAISSGASDIISITNNTISGLVTGSAAFVNSFTGITNNAGTDVTITGNTITSCTAGGTGISLFTGITTYTAGSGALTITGNSIISGINAGVGANATFTAISNLSTFATININDNIIGKNSITSANGIFNGILNSGAVTSAININNNQLGNASGGLITYTVANSGALTGINNIAGTGNCDLTIQGNDIQGITHSVAGSSTHTYIINSAATLTQNINSNTFTNLSVNTTGAILFISNNVVMPTQGVQNVNSNKIVTAFARTASSGAITIFNSTASTNNNNVTINNNGNDFSNITINGTASIAGWINTDAGLGTYTKTIDGNTFSNWNAGSGTGTITALTVNIASTDNSTKNNKINTINSAGSITGITTGAGNDNIFSNTIHTLLSIGTSATIVNGIAITTTGITKNVYQNTIYNLQANNITAGNVSGIAVTGGSSNFIYRNSINRISSSSNGITTGSVNGILVSGSSQDQITTIHNNKIGALHASAANVSNPICGININNTGARSTNNVYYNTIYLKTGSSGSLFGSSGISATANSTSTNVALDLRNNIIVNISTPNGTGQTVAYRRSSGGASNLANYASTSNNNLFYAGTPGTNQLIYVDGTSTAQTLTAYKNGVFTAGTISPRDQASVTEMPPFLSTDSTSLNYLKINPITATQIESGAVYIPNIPNDFEGNIRHGNDIYSGNPDIGAFEGNYKSSDFVPPSISYTLLSNITCSNTNRNFTAVINDATGVNVTAGTKPRIYYKKVSNLNTLALTNDNTTNGWKYTEVTNTSNPFTFTIDYSLIFGGVTTGDAIQYFVVAQDIVTPTPYVGINAGTFTNPPSSVNLTSSAFPVGGVNNFTIYGGLSGIKTIGLGGDYSTLTGAGGLFSDINSKGLSGNLEVRIKSNITETGANALNQIMYGCTDNSTLTIKPDIGVAAVLEGDVNISLININGADNVKIDGLNTGGSSLTIRNKNAGATATAISFATDATNNTITNCVIEGCNTSSTSGVIVFGAGISTGNDGNIISNNTIRPPAGTNLPVNSIYSAGTSTLIDNSGITISGNLISDYFSPTLSSNGIYIATNSSGWAISGNKFFQTVSRSSSTAAIIHRAIQIKTASGDNYTITNNTIGFADASLTGNTAYDGTFTSFRAIELTSGNTNASSIQGNTIANLSISNAGASAAPGIFSGIYVLGGKVNIGTVTGNTIGASSGNGSITVSSTLTGGFISGIYVTSASNATIQNNIIGSILTTEAPSVGYTFYGIYTAGGGQTSISANLIGSTSSNKSIAIGSETTTPICTLNGITNAATGSTSITNNTVQNVSVYGTGSSALNGILNSGITDVVNIIGNKIIAINNTGTTTTVGSTKVGWIKGISNTAAATNLNINNNIVRSLTKTVAGGEVFGIANTGGVLTTINVNNNQLGNSDGGFISYSNLSNTAILYSISNTGGAASCALSIQSNNIQGINYIVAGINVHTYIINTAATLTQNISSNTFTNLDVNTTGSVTFITISSGLFASGVQTVSSNKIVGTFNKSGVGGTVTFCNATGTSQPGSVITQNQNNFSNVTVTGATIISGWINSNTCLNKTINTNIFSNWTGGSAPLTAMTITAGSSTISANSISNMTTGTAAAAPIVVISSGATDVMSITNNTISGLSTGSDVFVNSFTGITNNAGTDVTITGNTITGCTAGGTVASIFTGITTNTAGSGTLTITGNSIISGTNAGTGAFNAILNAAPFATASINSNIIRSNSLATGTFTAISNTGNVTNATNINSNQLGNADDGLVTYSVASTATLLGISNTAGTASCNLTIQYNNIQGINYVVTGTNTNTYIINSAATFSQNISNNTFTNLSVNTTGAIIIISNSVIMPVGGVQNINGNSIVTSFTRTASSGALTLYTSTTSTANVNVIINNKNNNFSNININGTATISGWINTDAGLIQSTKVIDGNIFNNWTGGTGTITALNVNTTTLNNSIKNNTISNINSVGSIYAITTGAGNDNIFSNNIYSLISTGTVATVINGIAITTGTTKNIYQNTIYNLQANAITTGSVSGIAVSGGITVNIFRNKIYNISSLSSGITTGTVNGIIVSAAITDLTVTIHTNKIAHLYAPVANSITAVRGISIVNTGARSNINVYYNTVFLDGTSTGTNFGSAAIYHSAGAISSTSYLTLRNNIFVNLTIPSGTGAAVAFLRSNGAANMLNNFATTSNNNLYYSGVSSVTKLIYKDGTSQAETLTAYKSGNYTAGKISPRDQLSVSEMPPFLSTDGTSDDFLKIDPTSITFIESGAVNISGITLDYDNEVRSGNPNFPIQVNGCGTAPDIGADEFDGKQPSIIVSNANASSIGGYANLGAAFTAINSNDQTGKNILVTVTGNTNEPTVAVLNSGNWLTFKIYPVSSGKTISGNITSAPLIDLNGADNVSIDGRVNQTGTIKSLTITNTGTSSVTGTSTIRFRNSAESNTVKYCNVYGSTTSSTDGILTFYTSVSGNGNDNNLIENCNITNSGGNRPLNAIYSVGTAGMENDANIIRTNNIYNFLNAGISSSGISLNAYSSNWTIDSNNFYETSAFTPTSSLINYKTINIDNLTGVNFNITGNFIGGNTVACGGESWTINSNTSHNFQGIYINVGTSIASSIQNNTILNWNYSSSSNMPWQAIHINEGAVNIGTVTGNMIGSGTGTGSIVLSSYVNAQSFGIYTGSAGTVAISKNIIGSINTFGFDATYSHSFSAIYKKSGISGSLSISNNTIGSTLTPNSILAGSAAGSSSIAQNLIAIYSESTGKLTATSNIIANLTNAYAGSENSRTNAIYITAGTSNLLKNNIYNLSSASLGVNVGSVTGIELNGVDSTNTLTENTINNLSNTNSGFQGFIIGISFAGNSGINLVNRNFIRNLSVHASTTNASIYGIQMASGATTYANNIISLGGDTRTTIYGIYAIGTSINNSNLYFNTIYINGNLNEGTTNKSYALYSANNTNTRDFRNNIFANFRTTVSGSALHYAAYFNYANSNNLTLNNNNYYTSGVGGVTGHYNNMDVVSLPIVTDKDINSTFEDPQFVNAGGPTASDFKQFVGQNGEYGTGINLDYSQAARGNPPSMGAWEFNSNSWVGSVSTDFGDLNNWSSLVVPVDEAPVVFAVNPLRDCVLDINRTIGNIVNNQSTYKLAVNGKQLTLKGGIYFTNGAQIDATAAASKLIFSNDDVMTIPDGAFVNNLIPSLTVVSDFGILTVSDLTVSDTLNLSGTNPSATRGILHAETKTITMGANAVNTGDGDVTGIVKRTSIIANKTYTFGNKNTKINFQSTGTLPTEISMKIRLGQAPAWKPEAVKRYYEIIQTGATSQSPTSATLTLTYLDAELNGNDETKIVDWSYKYSGSLLTEQGRANSNISENWIRLADVDFSFYPSTFGSIEIGLSESKLETLTWNGSVSTSWTSVSNWTPTGAPSDNVNIIIPDGANTTFDPDLPSETNINTLKLESGAILNSVPGAQSIINGDDNAWLNEGGIFNPNTSTVIFNNAQANISGNTNFYNVTINDGAGLEMQEGSTMKISGTMNNSGPWFVLTNGPTTVEYNGTDQMIVVPNNENNKYSTLVLSGSGTKTMPSTVLTISGDLTFSGTVNVTAKNDLSIGGSFIIGQNATFTTVTKNHSIGGNFTQNGTFNSTGSTITLNGFGPQSILGTSLTTTFENLIIQNSTGITSSKDITVNGFLDLQSANPGSTLASFNMGTKTLSLGILATTLGIGDVSGIVKRSHTFNNNVPYSFGNKFNTLTILPGGTNPTELTVKSTIGTSPTWKPSAINRVYQIAKTGGSFCSIDVSLKFLESELNGNTDENLVLWKATGFPTPSVVEWGRTEINNADKILTVREVNISLLPTSLSQMEISMANTEFPTLTWNGSISTKWNDAVNWSPNSFPNQFSSVIIPNEITTNFDPTLPLSASVDNVKIAKGGVLNTSANTQLTLNGQNKIGWLNSGGVFNAGSSTVNVPGKGVVFGGSTNFFNLNILSNADLTLQTNSGMGIEIANFIVSGTFSAALNTTLTLLGDVTQNIGGSSVLNIENLVVNNPANVNMNVNINVGKVLTLSQGILNINGNILGINGAISRSAGQLNTSVLSTLSFGGSGAITLNNNLFYAEPNIKEFSINRIGELNLGNQNLTVNHVLDLISGTFNIGANTLTMKGSVINFGVGNINASNVGSNLIFNNIDAIVLPATAFTGILNNFSLLGSGGITSLGDLTVNGILNLQATNPSVTIGILDMKDGLVLKTLNMGITATTIGLGDVSGIVRRTGFAANTNYTFGNEFTYITFLPGGTYPTEIKAKIQIGAAPAWKSSAIKRIYDFAQTGGTNCVVSVSEHYLENELNSNDEASLVHWTNKFNTLPTPNVITELSKSSNNITNNWVKIENVEISSFYNSFGVLECTLANFENANSTWNGSVSNAWNNQNNWTPNFVPGVTSNVNIPNASTVTFSPVTPQNVEINSLTLAGSSLLSCIADGTMKVNNAWSNQGGTFNPVTSTVSFVNTTLNGSTNFFNINIPELSTLAMVTGSRMGISGSVTNNGTWLASNGSTTVEYNGTNQIVSATGGTQSIYSNLILSGSGIKTLPVFPLQINGDLTISGSAIATTANDLTISYNLNLMNTSKLNISTATSVKVNGNVNNNVGIDGLHIKSGPLAENGTFIFNGTPPLATVEMYSKSFWTGTTNKVYSWQYFGLPVQNLSNVTPTFDGAYVRKYNPAGTGSGLTSDKRWIQLVNGSSMNAIDGFEIVQAEPKTYYFTGQLYNESFTRTFDFISEAQYPGQNIISNPYTAAIDIAKINFGENADPTIYLYNTGSYADWLNASSSIGLNPGQYQPVTPETAGIGGIPFQIPSMQAFLVKTLVSSSISFDYSTITQKNNEKQRVRENKSLTWMRINLTSPVSGGEVMWLFNVPGTKSTFDKGWDAFKIINDSNNPQLYAAEMDGKYQIDVVPTINQTNINFKASSKDSLYTLTFTHENIQNYFENVYLFDKVTNTLQNITHSGTTYSFVANNQSAETRFKILTYDPDTSDNQESNGPIYVFGTHDNLYIDNQTKQSGKLYIYDGSGRMLLNVGFGRYETKNIHLNLHVGAYITHAVTDKFTISKTLILK